MAADRQAVTDLFYDARGLKSKETVPYEAAYVPGWGGNDANQPHTTWEYDLLGRPTLVTAPDQSQTRTTYDRRRTTVAAANDHRRATEVDALGRLVRLEEYDESHHRCATTRYGYTAADDLRTVTDEEGHVTEMTYDHLGRKVTMRDPDMGFWRYSYDPGGNLLRQTDAKGQAIRFRYDDLDRLTHKDYHEDGDVEVVYHYDQGPNALGRRSKMTDQSGQTTWKYDNRGRVTVQAQTGAGVRTYRLGYEYDALDRQTTLIYPDGERVTTTYDDRGQAGSLTSSFGPTFVTANAYNPLGQLTHRTYGSKATAAYSYYSP